MRKCDIIIPIYNAFDCLSPCIESVIKNTDFSMAHLFLIDDKSSDERVLPLLEKYIKKYPEKITLLRNKKNLGFVGTVNKGMRVSKNDVLLLNSDTEVPSEWLDTMRECEYSGELIATVTPLSNNATLASVPVSFERNELPKGYDLEKMNRLVRDFSMRLKPELPTGHGFCMYIRREALDEVGFFDEKRFGRGYGEENDFCFRCMRQGYRNVLCDSVYVLHKESQSFLKAKKDNLALLKSKHPELTYGLGVWCASGDIKVVGDNVALGLGVSEKRPNILIVVHTAPNSMGGTTLHLMDLINKLRAKYNFHVLFVENGMYKVRSFFKDYEIVTGVYRKPICITRSREATDLAPDELFSSEYAKMFSEVLEKYQISFVHIHHMLGHYFDIIEICKTKKVRYMVSLHDTYLYFPIANMLAEEVGVKKEAPMNVERWRGVCKKLLEGAGYIIAPSEAERDKYKGVYGNLKISVISHGVDLKKVKASHRLKEGVKNIAFVGGIGLQKGSEIIEAVVPELEKRGGIKVHLFGLTTARVSRSKIFVDHGVYKRKSLPKLLHNSGIDLVCNFSLCFESYSYVVDEVAASGLPSLVFDFGASGERVRQKRLGWVMKYSDDPVKLADVIEEILGNEGEYMAVMRAIDKYEIKSLDEMASEYDAIYAEESEEKEIDYRLLRDGMLFNNLVQSVVDGVKKYDEEEYNARLKGLYETIAEYSKVTESMRWNVVSGIVLPGWVSRIARRVYDKKQGRK